MAKNDSDPEPLEGGDPLLARLERHGELRVARVASAESKGADGAAYAAAPHSVGKAQDTLPPTAGVILDITNPGSAIPPSEPAVETPLPGHMNTTVSTPLARATRLRNGLVGAALALAVVVLALAGMRSLRGRHPDDEAVQVTSAATVSSAPSGVARIASSSAPSATPESSGMSTSVGSSRASSAATVNPRPPVTGAPPSTSATPRASSSSHAISLHPAPSGASQDTPPSHPTASANPDLGLMHNDPHSSGGL